MDFHPILIVDTMVRLYIFVENLESLTFLNRMVAQWSFSDQCIFIIILLCICLVKGCLFELLSRFF